MRSKCPECGNSYDDFVRLKICPHEIFPVSYSAKSALLARGLCVECGIDADHECEKDQTGSYVECPNYINIRKMS